MTFEARVFGELASVCILELCPKLDRCRLPHSFSESRRLVILGATIGSPREPRVNAINTRTVSRRKSWAIPRRFSRMTSSVR